MLPVLLPLSTCSERAELSNSLEVNLQQSRTYRTALVKKLVFRGFQQSKLLLTCVPSSFEGYVSLQGIHGWSVPELPASCTMPISLPSKSLQI